MQAWKVEKNKEKLLKKAAAALKKGKVLVCPTDTVYGLVADATQKKAVQKVFAIKGRGKKRALPVFVNSIAAAKRLAKVSARQEKLLERFWPGKTTVILTSRGVLPKETGTKTTIGLRIPKHDLVLALLTKAKTPLTGTSANLSGKVPLRDSKDIVRQFQERKYAPDIVLAAGKLPFSHPSRVLDITGPKVKALRK